MPRNDHERWQMDLEEYIRQGEPEQSEKSTAWKTAIGLQDVDGLKTSEYLLETAKEHIEGRIDIMTAQKRIQSYYEQRQIRTEIEDGTKEADIVSARIVRNSLARANYNDLGKGISATTVYLERFFENLLLGYQNELKNRFIHVDYKEQSAIEKDPKCNNSRFGYGQQMMHQKKWKRHISWPKKKKLLTGEYHFNVKYSLAEYFIRRAAEDGLELKISTNIYVPMLYTDADYTASNACYEKIGYVLRGKLCTIG